MVWRSRVIFTRSSRAASSAGDGARTCTEAAGWLTGVGEEAAFSMAAQHVTLGDAAVLAGARHGRGIDA